MEVSSCVSMVVKVGFSSGCEPCGRLELGGKALRCERKGSARGRMPCHSLQDTSGGWRGQTTGLDCGRSIPCCESENLQADLPLEAVAGLQSGDAGAFGGIPFRAECIVEVGVGADGDP